MKKLALVTGAAGDIGRACVQMLADEGYSLWLLDIDRTRLEKVKETFPAAEIEVCDLADRPTLEELCQRIESLENPLALALINAAIIMPGDFADCRRPDIDRQIDINLRSTLHLNHACVHKMKAQGGGHLVNVVSMGGIVPMQKSAVYTGTKAGVRGFLAAAREELRPHGVFVSGVYPSGVDTRMLLYEATNEGNLLNFFGPPAKISDVVRTVRRTLRTQKLENYVSYLDSMAARLVSSFPWLLRVLNPVLNRLGQHWRKKFLQSKKAE